MKYFQRASLFAAPYKMTRVRWFGWMTGATAIVCAVWHGAFVSVALGFLGLQHPPAISTRTLTSTVAGGGFAAIAPPKEAPLVSPAMTARDPLGRGFYVVDEVGGTSLLKFINTSNAPVTLAGVTIPANYIGLIAGGGVAPETGTAREVDLSLVTGIAIDPAGTAIYVANPLINAVRAINLGTQPMQIMGQTIAPLSIGNVFQISRPELRALAVHPVTRDFYYISTLSNSSTIKVIYRRGNASGLEAVFAGGSEPAVGNGDEGQATNARIVSPIALAFDKDRRLLISEGGDVRRNPGAIRRVDESGTITSLAKNLDFPTGLSIAPNGDVYVALGNKQQIARVSANGALTVVAGNNNATACNTEGTSTCGDGGAALLALLTLPASTDNRTMDFAVDASGVIIPGLATRRVRYASFSNAPVTIAGTTIEAKQINSIAGNGQEAPYDNIPATSSELQLPAGVAIDPNGNMFIADTAPDPVSRLRFVNRGAAPVTLFATTSWAKTVQPGHIVTLNDRVGEPSSDDRITNASLQWPQGMHITTKGLFLIDSQYGALIKPQGSLNGKRSGHLRFLNTSDTDVVIFPAAGSFKIVVPPGQIKDIAGVNEVAPNSGYGLNGKIGDGGQSVGAVLFPSDVVVSPGGNIFIADQGNNRIRVIDAFSGLIRSVETVAADGQSIPLTTNGATGMAFDAQGRLVIADTKQNQILRQTTPSGPNFVVIANTSQGVNRPRDVVVDASNNIYVSNSGTSQVLRIVAPNDALGTVTVVAGTALRGFAGDGGTGLRAKFDLPNPTTSFDVQLTASLAFTLTGDLLVADGNNNRIRMLTPVPNQPPVVTAPPDTTLKENETTTLNFSVTDGNSDPLAITISNRPSFVTFTDTGNGTGRLTVAPTFTDAGTYTLTISANDGDATETKTFKITVTDVNRPPTASAQSLGAALEANSAAGRQLLLPGSGTDPDHDPLTFKWFDGTTQIAQIASPTVTLGFGSHSLMLTVTDSKGLSASTTAQTVLVQDTTPPVFATVPADLSVQASGPTPVNFTLPTANDAVDGAVVVTAQPASGSVFPSGATTVIFTARDARNNTATASFRVTVSASGGGTGGGGTGGRGTGGGTTPASFIISTYAGNGSYSFSGDGGAAVDASFREIRTIHRDANGNVFTVDAASRNVRRINAQGQIFGFAGNGITGNDGDNKQATTANFNTPSAVTSDAQGNVYIADAFYNRVRRVTPDGKIGNFAGSSSGASGFGGDFGAPALARLSRPSGLAVSGYFLYIADTGNNRIRRVDLQNNIITTYAGDGIAAASGDGSVATSANLNNPVGLALDVTGHLYIADRNNHRIRRVDAITKIITTVAGTGQPGFSGEDVAARSAQLNSPNDVAVDAAGNLYIADQANHRIRRITTNGVIKTVAGTGEFGFGGDNGSALSAPLNAPAAVKVDPQGNLFITDTGNLRVRRLTASTGTTQNRNPVITTSLTDQTLVVGQTLELPLNATDADNDNVTFTLLNAPGFVTITNANATQRSATLRLAPTQTGTFNGLQVQASDGKGGTATSLAFKVTVNEATGANRPPTANANTLASTVEATAPGGATINLIGQGNDPDGDALTFTWVDGATSIAAGANANATLSIGSHGIKLVVNDGRGGVAMTAPQTVIVRDTTAPVISNVPASITMPATSASGAAVTFTLPTANDAVDGVVTVNASRASGSIFSVGTTTVTFTARDSRNNEATASFMITVTSGAESSTPASYIITTFAGTGEFGYTGDGGPATSANFRNLISLNRDKDGNLLLADPLSRVIRRITADGTIRTVAGNGTNGNTGDNSLSIYASFGAPSGEAMDGVGNLYISDFANHRVRRISADGKITNFAGSANGQSGGTGDQSTAPSARLNRPTALAVDAQNNLYILDGGNGRVRRVDAVTNIITTYAGTGINGFGGDGGAATGANFSYPSSIAFDAQGNLYIADRSNHRIRRIDAATQIVTTVAGNGVLGFGGDGGQATIASLNLPTDVALDAAGNLYIVDQGNHRIRRVRARDRVIETIAGTGTQSFGGDNGPAAQAHVNAPTAINAAADGSIYIADNGNLRIRKLAPAGGTPPPPANRNPVITSALGNQSLSINQTLDVPLTATDEDSDAVTFSLLGAPSFAAVINANATQRTATLRLAPTQAGTFNGVQVRATDGKNGSTTSAAFNIVVTESSSGSSNQPPVIQTLADQTVTRGQAIDIELRATDANNDPVTFALENAPAFATLIQANPVQRTAILRIAPPLEGGDVSSSMRVRADDGRGGVATSNIFTVNIRALGTGGVSGNRPPTAIAGVLSAIVAVDTSGSALVRLDGTASTDPDGDALSFTWLDRDAVIATMGVADVRLAVGDHLISLRVSDNRGGISTTLAQSVKVTAQQVAAPLSIQSISPASGKRGATVTVTITGSGFQPGAVVDFGGANITEVTTYVNSSTLVVRVSIGSTAYTVPRAVFVTNPDETYVSKPNAFLIN